MAISVRRKKRLMSEINVVPYIDVMLVLLVIFMITAPLLTQGVKVDLPQASAQPIKTPKLDNIVVTVDKQGRLYLDEKTITSSKLKQKVRKILRLQPKTPVLVRADKRVAYGKVIDAMSVLQDAGAPSVGLITQPRSKQKR